MPSLKCLKKNLVGLCLGLLQSMNLWSASERPNILFIMSDDHTSQAWGCYGSRFAPAFQTPHIDRLAKEGALLRNCFVTNSISVIEFGFLLIHLLSCFVKHDFNLFP